MAFFPVNQYSGLIVYFCLILIDVYSMKAFKEVASKSLEIGVNVELRRIKDYEFSYFTLWNFTAQIIFLITAILDESSKLVNLPVAIQKRFSRFRAFIYNSVVFPCSLVVSSIFWTIWHIDRDLIFPKEVDAFFPSWLNHTLHTAILIPLIVESLLPKKYNFVKFQDAAKVLLGFVFVYQMLYLSIYLRHGVWLYPFFEHLSWTQRALFGIFNLFMALVFQRVGIEMQNRKRPPAVEKIK